MSWLKPQDGAQLIENGDRRDLAPALNVADGAALETNLPSQGSLGKPNSNPPSSDHNPNRAAQAVPVYVNLHDRMMLRPSTQVNRSARIDSLAQLYCLSG